MATHLKWWPIWEKGPSKTKSVRESLQRPHPTEMQKKVGHSGSCGLRFKPEVDSRVLSLGPIVSRRSGNWLKLCAKCLSGHLDGMGS